MGNYTIFLLSIHLEELSQDVDYMVNSGTLACLENKLVTHWPWNHWDMCPSHEVDSESIGVKTLGLP